MVFALGFFFRKLYIIRYDKLFSVRLRTGDIIGFKAILKKLNITIFEIKQIRYNCSEKGKSISNNVLVISLSIKISITTRMIEFFF